MPPSIYDKRTRKLQRRLEELGCDALLILQPENRRYLSGFLAADGQANESSGCLLLTNQKRLLLTDFRFAQEAQEQALDYETITVKKEYPEELAAVLHDLGCRVLGFEEDTVTCGLLRRLQEACSAFAKPPQLLPLQDVVENMRLVKDKDELLALSASAEMISALLDILINELQPGRQEREVAWRLRELALEAGAEDVSFAPIVASGPNSALPHAVAGERRLAEGEPIVLDVGVKFNG